MATVSPFVELRRYFLSGFVRPSFLGEHGAEALRGLLVTLGSAVALLGLFLPYPLLKKYWYLSSLESGEAYTRALLSDQALMIAVPMIVIGLVMSLVAPSLYVDDTDFLVLTPLPVSRATVFAAKLAAVAIFVGLFVVALNTAGNLWFPAITGGRWAAHPLLARLWTHTAASLLATSFVPLVFAVLQGLTVTVLPRTSATRASTAVQVLLLTGLAAAMPALLRMPGLLDPEPWMRVVPPFWFVGIARYLLGARDPLFVELAAIGVTAYAIAIVALVGCYAAAYLQHGNADSATGFSPSAISLKGSAPGRWLGRWQAAPATRAGLDFIRATVARSRLNLIVLAGILAIGVGLVVDTLLTTTAGRYRVELQSREVAYRAIAPSLMLMLTALVGLRATFLLPMTRDANWIFRQLDARSAREGLLTAVEWWFVVAGTGVPLAIGLPLQFATFGPVRTLLAAPLVALVGLVMVEALLRTWRRVPFTCSYIPGKQHVALVLIISCAAYWIFVYVAGHIISWSTLRPSRWLMIGGVLLALWAWLRRRRLAAPDRATLEFEDEMPDVVRSLDLFS